MVQAISTMTKHGMRSTLIGVLVPTTLCISQMLISPRTRLTTDTPKLPLLVSPLKWLKDGTTTLWSGPLPLWLSWSTNRSIGKLWTALQLKFPGDALLTDSSWELTMALLLLVKITSFTYVDSSTRPCRPIRTRSALQSQPPRFPPPSLTTEKYRLDSLTNQYSLWHNHR